jgi:hypothetical protein
VATWKRRDRLRSTPRRYRVTTLSGMLTFVGMEPHGLEDCSYTSRVVNDQALVRATNEEPFAREALAVLDELLQSVTLVARLRRVDQDGEPQNAVAE